MTAKWSNPTSDAHTFLEPTYESWKFLLGSIVQSSTLDQLKEEVGGVGNADISDWNTFAIHFVGYLVCLSLGLVILLAVWIGGPIYCCCGCCCCNEKNMKSGSRKVSCCTLFFMLCFMLMVAATLMGCIIMIVSLCITNEEVKSGGAKDTIQGGIHGTEQFFLDAVDEMEDTVVDTVDNGTEVINDIIDDIPDRTKDSINSHTNILTLLDEMEEFLEDINGSAITLNNILHDMNNYTLLLDKLLEDERVKLCNIFKCNSSICKVTSTIPYVTTTEDPGSTTEALMTTTTEKSDPCYLVVQINLHAEFTPNTLVDFANVSNLATEGLEAVKDGNKEIEDTADKLKSETEAKKGGVEEETDKLKSGLNTTFHAIRNVIEDAGMSDKMDEWDDMEDDLSTYWDIWFSAALVIGLLMCVSPLLFTAGCCYALCGGNRKSRPRAACILRSGVCVGVLVCILIPLVGVVLLLLGGLVHTEFCRYMHDPVTHRQSVDTIDDIIRNATDLEFNILDGILECEDNTALYTAFQLYTIDDYNFDDDLDISQVEEELNKLRNTSIEVNLSIMKDARALTQLELVLGNIPYADYQDVMNSDVTVGSLTQISEQLDALHLSGAYGNDSDLSSISQSLQNLDMEFVKTIEDLQKAFLYELEVFKNISDNYNISEELTYIDEANTNLNDIFPTIEKEVLDGAVDESLVVIEDVVNSINNSIYHDVAQCKPLFDVLYTAIEYTCVDLLYPINAFWFGIGWFIIFFFISSFMACCLSGKFKAQYGAAQTKEKYMNGKTK